MEPLAGLNFRYTCLGRMMLAAMSVIGAASESVVKLRGTAATRSCLQ
jgi:hypothetical protein